MAYFTQSQTIKYADKDEFSNVKVGDIYFLELDIHVDKIPVAFEITVLDHENRIIRFNYLKQNKSNGLQTLYFEEVPGEPNKTILKHVSYFKSDNRFRDRHGYIPIHVMLIDDFHKNMIERENKGKDKDDQIKLKTVRLKKKNDRRYLDKSHYQE